MQLTTDILEKNLTIIRLEQFHLKTFLCLIKYHTTSGFCPPFFCPCAMSTTVFLGSSSLKTWCYVPPPPPLVAAQSIPCDCPFKTVWPSPPPPICMLSEAPPVLLLFYKMAGNWPITDTPMERVGKAFLIIILHRGFALFLDTCSIKNFMNFLFSTLIWICTMKTDI